MHLFDDGDTKHESAMLDTVKSPRIGCGDRPMRNEPPPDSPADPHHACAVDREAACSPARPPVRTAAPAPGQNPYSGTRTRARSGLNAKTILACEVAGGLMRYGQDHEKPECSGILTRFTAQPPAKFTSEYIRVKTWRGTRQSREGFATPRISLMLPDARRSKIRRAAFHMTAIQPIMALEDLQPRRPDRARLGGRAARAEHAAGTAGAARSYLEKRKYGCSA